MGQSMYGISLEAGKRHESLLDDLVQSIRIILSTPKGAKIGDPDFGCDLWDQLDQPSSNIPLMIASVVKALRRDEPRIEVLKVKPRLDELASGQIHFEIEGKLVENGAFFRVSVPV